jgi:hypothetical protein
MVLAAPFDLLLSFAMFAKPRRHLIGRRRENSVERANLTNFHRAFPEIFYGSVESFDGSETTLNGFLKQFHGLLKRFYGSVPPFYALIKRFYRRKQSFFDSVEWLYQSVEPFIEPVKPFQTRQKLQKSQNFDHPQIRMAKKDSKTKQ